MCLIKPIINFNPRSHEESDRLLFTISCIVFYFNPRSHEESDLLTLINMLNMFVFQSTLSRRERQNDSPKWCHLVMISIHALTKRATFFLNSFLLFFRISIHALTKRATGLKNIFRLLL